MQIDLKDRVAVVTGAGRGIGRTIALTLRDEGARVVGLDYDQDNLRSLADEIGPSGSTAMCDVRSREQVQHVVKSVIQEHQRLDIVVNNAGVGPMGPVETLSEEHWDANLDVNLKGVFLMCQAVIPQMKKQRSGRIINAASFAAIIPSLNSAAYAASKAGVYALTRVLAGELGPWNITVNCYAPGMIPTELNHFTELPAERQTKLLDTLTLRRWGEARDVANLVCFLASDLAGYITGTMIDCSGGKLATQIPRLAYDAASIQFEI